MKKTVEVVVPDDVFARVVEEVGESRAGEAVTAWLEAVCRAQLSEDVSDAYALQAAEEAAGLGGTQNDEYARGSYEDQTAA